MKTTLAAVDVLPVSDIPAGCRCGEDDQPPSASPAAAGPGPSPLLPVVEALARALAAAPELGTETLPLGQARGRVLAAPARAAHPLPLFTQSAVDGYAVRHADIACAPCVLPLGAHIAARPQAQQPLLAPRSAARILTGGLMPLGADTVVRQERTQTLEGRILVLEAMAPGTDVRKAGEEMAAGAVVADLGARLTPGLIGALALAGVHEVTVRRLPRITVLVSGDEVQAGGETLGLGQVPDANGPLVAAWLAEWGCPAQRIEHIPDRPAAVRVALARAFADSDLVLTTGGVSVGDHDHIPAMAEQLGARRLLWKVAQKPGMPLYLARCGGALLCGLPGNPASVMVNLLVYGRSVLDAMQGLDPARRWRRGKLVGEVKRDPHKTLWLRMAVDYDINGAPRLKPLRGQASHMLGNLAEAQALVEVPSEEGVKVRWVPLVMAL